MDAAGVDAIRRQVEDADGAAAHAVTAPAEDDGVDPPGQNPLQQYLALFLVEKPAHEEVHVAGRNYQECPDKTKESQLRKCETPPDAAKRAGFRRCSPPRSTLGGAIRYVLRKTPLCMRVKGAFCARRTYPRRRLRVPWRPRRSSRRG